MTRLATALVLVTVLVDGCGGGSGGSGGVGVDGTKQISDVNETEKASLCDWFAAKVGGYGTVPACADAVLKAPPSQDACLTSFPTCAVTVSQFQSCIDTIVAAQTTCTQQSLASVQADANCQMVADAGSFNP